MDHGSPLPPVIDSHAHVFTKDMPLTATAWNRPDYEYSAEDWLEDLDQQGIAFGVIAALTLYGHNVDYTLECLRRHKRLRATIMAPLDVDKATLRRYADAGVVGVRVGFRRAKELPDFRSEPYLRFLRNLADTGLHLQLLALGKDMPVLIPAIQSSGVKLVVDHFGDPDKQLVTESPGFVAALRGLDAAPDRTFVKLAATLRIPVAVSKACAAKLLAVAGPERLLWGSDAPFVGHEEPRPPYVEVLHRFYEIVPDARQRHQIGLTALREFFF
jgi:predicted TIM-barrel fold metal-dependent hydrolase